MVGYDTDGVITLLPKPPTYGDVDFEHPQQQKVLEHYLVFGIGGPLALIALVQRYYTKIWLSKGLQVDDAFMFLGWAMSLITQVLLTWSISQKGLTVHAWEMPLTRFETYSIVTYVTAPIFMLCNGFTKLSLLTFYLHLSPQKMFRLAVWASIGIVAVYTVLITMMMFFQCRPIRKSWDASIEGGTCIHAGILYMATAVSNIITDVMLFLLPIPMVLQLRMGLGQKIGAIIIFGIGSMTLATSIVRLTYLPPTLKSTDPSWDAAPANVWTFVEANLFVICGSMPTLRKFFKHFAPKLMGGSSSDPSYGNSYAVNPSTVAQSRARKQRRQYEQFEEEENEMQVFPNQTEAGKGPGYTATTVDVGNGGDADAHSEKAILQTKSFTVQYDQ